MKKFPELYTPKVSGPWQEMFIPKKEGHYINDHSVVKGPDGAWHLFGITSHGGGPSMERYFVHAVGDEHLLTPMEEKGRVIDNGTRAWAPGVIQKDSKYYMFYGPSPTKLDISEDLGEWMGYEIRMEGVPPMACHRDHFVTKLKDDLYVMYVVGVKDRYGAVSALVSNDLLSWRYVDYCLRSDGNAPLTPPWGAFESPYMVEYHGLYYLFVTYTDCGMENYQDTLVFASANPFDFGTYTGDNYDDLVVAKLHAHAGEVLLDPETGKYYLTACGWDGYHTPVEGGVGIAELTWEKAER